LTRRAPPPPGESLTPGKPPAAVTAPAAAAPNPLPQSGGDSRRVAPPARPLVSPAQAIQFPSRTDDAAPHFEVARGPRHAGNVTPLRPAPSSANPFPVPPVHAQPAPAPAPHSPATTIHIPAARVPPAAPAQPLPAQSPAPPRPMPPRQASAIPPPPVVEREAPAEAAAAAVAAAAAAANWRIPQQTARADDPLLDCLIVLTAIFERPHSAEALTAGLPLVQNRITPELFIRAASRAGLAARIVKRPIAEISDLSLPCVLLLNDARACILTALTGGKATVIVPETGHGTVEVPQEHLAQRYTGYALFARPEYQFDARSEATEIRPTRNWFWGTLGRFWRIYTQVGLAAVFVNLFAIALPLFTMNVYDRVVPTKGQETLWVLVLGVGIIFAFEFLLRMLRSYFVDTAGRSADVIMASAVFQQVLGIRLDQRPQSAGAFAQQLREFESLRDFFTSATLVTLIDLPFVLLFIGVVAMIGGPVALVPMIAVPLIIGVGWFLQVPLNEVVTRTARESAQKHALLVESIVGLETIKGLGAEGRTQRNWERFVGLTAKSAQRARELSQFGQYFTGLVSQIVSVAVVVVGVYLIFEGHLTVGALIACTILTGRAMAPLTQVAALLTRVDGVAQDHRQDHGPARGAAGRHAVRSSPDPARRDRVPRRRIHLSQPASAGARRSLVLDPARRAGRHHRQDRLGQEHDRKADPRVLPAAEGRHPHRRDRHETDRSRRSAPQHRLCAAGRVPVLRLGAREHRDGGTLCRRRRDPARRAHRGRRQLRLASSAGLRSSGGRARRIAFGRPAPVDRYCPSRRARSQHRDPRRAHQRDGQGLRGLADRAHARDPRRQDPCSGDTAAFAAYAGRARDRHG
jgi:hypothetical protein